MPRKVTRRTGRAAATSVALGLAILGCSSQESKLYNIFRCGKAATLVGHAKSARGAGLKANAFEVQGSRGHMSMEFNQRFMDEYGSGRSLDSEAVLDLYGSRTCKKLYAP
ncbi:MAG: hypothetical protein RET84_02650 [Pseudomonadota bacterium]|nr:hypothetical protein [Pseudomonadota bacterium]